VEEDEVKNLSKRFFVNENSTAICMTKFYTAAWPTGMELWEPTPKRILSKQLHSERWPTNQSTTKELRVETCSLHKSLPTSCSLISHSCVWPQCWAQKQTPVTVTEDSAYASEVPNAAEDLDMAKLQTTAQAAIGLYEWGGISLGGRVSGILIQSDQVWEDSRPCPVFVCYTLAFSLQPRKKHGKTSVRVMLTSHFTGSLNKPVHFGLPWIALETWVNLCTAYLPSCRIMGFSTPALSQISWLKFWCGQQRITH